MMKITFFNGSTAVVKGTVTGVHGRSITFAAKAEIISLKGNIESNFPAGGELKFSDVQYAISVE